MLDALPMVHETRRERWRMGVFSRFKDIVNANINALLDKAEDPEKMLRLMLQEMEDALIELKSGCAARMASRIRLEKRIQEQKALVSRWQSRAQMAIDKGRDDLAREALVEKRKESALLESLESDLRGYEEIIARSREDIDQLEGKLAQARSKLKLLQEKARAERESGKANSRMATSSSMGFDDLEERIDRMRFENDLSRPRPDADAIFRSMEEKEEIEKELEQLKKEMRDE